MPIELSFLVYIMIHVGYALYDISGNMIMMLM